MKAADFLLSSTTLLTLIAALPLHVHGTRPYAFEIYSFTSNVNPDFFKAFTIKLIKSKNGGSVNGSCIPNIDLHDFRLGVKVLEVSGLRSQPWTLMDVTFNVCDIIVTAPKINLIWPIILNIKRHTHLLPDQCPFLKGKEYYLKNFSFNTEMFPPFIPSMKVRVMFGLEYRGVKFYEGNISAAIVTKHSRTTKSRGIGVGGK